VLDKIESTRIQFGDGVCGELRICVQVDIPAFAEDLEKLFVEIQTLDSQINISASSDLSSIAADVTVDNAQINRLLLEFIRVGETHGVRFPRYFRPEP
jgi:aarF domain-containing kinase